MLDQVYGGGGDTFHIIPAGILCGLSARGLLISLTKYDIWLRYGIDPLVSRPNKSLFPSLSISLLVSTLFSPCVTAW